MEREAAVQRRDLLRIGRVPEVVEKGNWRTLPVTQKPEDPLACGPGRYSSSTRYHKRELGRSIDSRNSPCVRDAIEMALEAELRAVLGAARYARVTARLGCRNGTQQRELGTRMGAIGITVPRAARRGGTRRVWHSAALPRYHRRLRHLDETILGIS
jgi:hypothetical protein